MSEYGLKIGMKLSEVKSLLAKTNATDKTKKLIIDFCNNDIDGKITDDIELHMLNTWASGQDKIPMPKLESVGTTSRIFKSAVGYLGIDTVTERDSDSKTAHIQTEEPMFGGAFTNIEFKNSYLYDRNGDGYADKYHSTLTDGGVANSTFSSPRWINREMYF